MDTDKHRLGGTTEHTEYTEKEKNNSVFSVYSVVNIGFPESAYLHKRVPKKQFLESGELVASDKKLFRENVKNVYWEYTLKPSTCPVLPYRDHEREYLEVAVLQIEMNSPKGHKRIAEIIHRVIPYPLMIGFYIGTTGHTANKPQNTQNTQKEGDLFGEADPSVSSVYSVVKKELDLGFKVFKLDSTNIKPWEVDFDMTERTLEDFISNIKTDRREEDVLYEILLKYGLDLTLPITEHAIAGQKVFDIGMGGAHYLSCRYHLSRSGRRHRQAEG